MFLQFLALICLLGSSLAFNGLRDVHKIHKRSSLETIQFTKEIADQKVGSLVIKRHSMAYCQLRIDFNTFEVGQINKYRNCEGGHWELNGQIQKNVPTLCGYNTGQHFYADFDERGTPITMNVTSDSEEAAWDITVTQISCDDEDNRVSADCTQSYTAVSGNFQSPGYKNIQFKDDPPITYQKNNQDITICFGGDGSSYSSIRYTRANGAFDFYFSLTGLVSVTPGVYIGTISSAIFGNNCTTDYVEIPSGNYLDSYGKNKTSDQFCGLGFPVRVFSKTKPFKLHYFTDGNEDKDDGNVGYSLFYLLS